MKRKIFIVLCFISMFVFLLPQQKINVEAKSKEINIFENSKKIDNNIDYEFSHEIKSISVVIKFNSSQSTIDTYNNKQYTLKEKDEKLKKERLKNKELAVIKNNCLNKEMNLSKYGYEFSEYSPFAFKTFNDLKTLEDDKKLLSKLSKNSDVQKIYINAEYNKTTDTSASTNITESNIITSLQDAKELININNSEATGINVKVGIIDSGHINNHPNFIGYSLTNIGGTTSGTVHHTAAVASIIGGTYGIAPNCELFVSRFSNGSNLQNSVEAMIDENISLINISAYSDYNTGNYALYDGYSAYLDYISWHYGICFVVASGNDSDSLKVVNPALGFNVITVGSTDGEKNVAYNSCWKVPNVDEINDPDATTNYYYLKPTLVAPGENIVIPNVSSTQKGEAGTSFAAPMVTGVIALLMETHPILVGNPQLISSVLISGCESLPGQINTWDPQGGAGFLNYKNSLDILGNSSNYGLGNLTNSNSNNDNLIDLQFETNYEALVRISITNNINSEVSAPSGELCNIYNSPIRIEIYKNSSILYTYYMTQNIYLIQFCTEDYLENNYRVLITATNAKYNIFTEKIALSIYKEHMSHNYNDSISWINTSSHTLNCICGKSIIEKHITKPNTNICIKCKGVSNSIIGGLSV